MEYTRLGRTGLTVSRIALGAVKAAAPENLPAAHALMDRALEHGINYLDTSNIYGPQGRGRLVRERHRPSAFHGRPRTGRACGVFRLTCAAESSAHSQTSASRSVPPAMSPPSPHPARPATVCDHQIRPGASRSAGLAEAQPRRVRRR